MNFTTRYSLQSEDSTSGDGAGGFSETDYSEDKKIRGTPPKPMSENRLARFGREVTEEIYEIFVRYRAVDDTFDPETQYKLVEQKHENRTFIIHARKDVKGQRRLAKLIVSEEN